MKVRSSHGVDHEVVGFISNERFILSIADYKPVINTIGSDAAQLPPNELWQDVTGECDVITGRFFHVKDGVNYFLTNGLLSDSYRLAKVEIGMRPGAIVKTGSYFRVEKKVTP